MELKLCFVASFFCLRLLLIVPYGIETDDINNVIKSSILLIVPYGIETVISSELQALHRTFNRTLWN